MCHDTRGQIWMDDTRMSLPRYSLDHIDSYRLGMNPTMRRRIGLRMSEGIYLVKDPTFQCLKRPSGTRAKAAERHHGISAGTEKVFVPWD